MKAIFITLTLLVLPIHTTLAVNATNANDACYHNNVRNALSYGTTLRDLGPWLDQTYNFAAQNRPATPLPPMQNKTSLKNSAASVASSCHFAHSGWNGVGENLFVGTEAPSTTTEQWQSDRNWWVRNAVNDWTNEARFVNYPTGANAVTCNEGSTGSACRSKIGHYTQIMWDDTTEVGCAAQYCPNGISNFTTRESTMIVCHYAPQGNYYDGTNYLAPYPGIGIQAPASNAPASSSCTSGAPGDTDGGDNTGALAVIINLLLND